MTAYVGGSTGFGPPSWTTAGRPSSPVNGQLGWNSTLGQLESWTGSLWQPITSLLYNVSYLVVAGGGGGGGSNNGGGGGGGGLLTGTAGLNSGTAYTITVGAGGTGGNGVSGHGVSGSNSVFTGIATAIGGGGGGGYDGGSGGSAGYSGGSGGGGGAATAGNGGAGTSGQGFAGRECTARCECVNGASTD